jgi:hypothetical protein
MADFTAYFDGSGSPHDTPVVTVAGFIATADQWGEFERNWRDACASFGVSALHMRDYAHSRREFENWKGDSGAGCKSPHPPIPGGEGEVFFS